MQGRPWGSKARPETQASTLTTPQNTLTQALTTPPWSCKRDQHTGQPTGTWRSSPRILQMQHWQAKQEQATLTSQARPWGNNDNRPEERQKTNDGTLRGEGSKWCNTDRCNPAYLHMQHWCCNTKLLNPDTKPAPAEAQNNLNRENAQ